jgi:hypothetical protein
MENSTTNPKVPRVFVSYSWDSDAHKKWVESLSIDLNSKYGILVILDEWDLKYGQNHVTWMSKEIGDSDRVILICTNRYVERADQQQGGVGYEGSIISAGLISNVDTFKFIPLLRDNDSGSIPRQLGARMKIDFRNDADYGKNLESPRERYS